jgi:hypothetical protein
MTATAMIAREATVRNELRPYGAAYWRSPHFSRTAPSNNEVQLTSGAKDGALTFVRAPSLLKRRLQLTSVFDGRRSYEL